MDGLEALFSKALRLESPWEIQKIEFSEEEGIIRILVDFPRGSEFCCPVCGKPVKAYDTQMKEFRHLNFFQYECYFVVRIPRIKCSDEGVKQVEVPWAREGGDFTYLFETFAMTLVREMPVNRVSKILKVDDNKLWRMMHYYTESAREQANYSDVTSIGIDETSRARGHDYVTLFVDLSKRRTVFVEKGKGAATISAFVHDFKAHHGSPTAITDASIDMSPAFVKGIKENLPCAQITFDKYHIMKIINSAVDKVRKAEVKDQNILRGLKYIFLKNRTNLTPSQFADLRHIESMPKLNLKTIRAYHIRENFQEIYKAKSRKGFEIALKKWYFWATHIGLPT